MMSTNKGIVLSGICALACAFVVLSAGLALAETCLLVYPSTSCQFHYDTARYQVLSPGHPQYDPAYDIGGQVLWDTYESRIPIEVYRAPLLTAFEPSQTGNNEFVTLHDNFDLILDGFGPVQRSLGNVLVHFVPVPHHSQPLIELDHMLIGQLVCGVPNLLVTTPLGNGFYADTSTHALRWSGTEAIRITAFSDKNNNGVFDGGEIRWSVVAKDEVVGVEERSWGAVKALYRD